ncbi:MAG: hypothetical protein R6X16_08775 [Anaerolineae bacterium]
MSHPGPSDVANVPVRETKRLYERRLADPDLGAGQPVSESESFAELDELLACARLAEPPSHFAAQVMVCVARRHSRQRTVRLVRRVMTVVVLLVAMIGGTVWLLSAVRASNAPIVGGISLVFEQIAAILQTLAVAIGVIARAIPGRATVLLGVWIAVAAGVSALWCAAVARVQPSRVHA